MPLRRMVLTTALLGALPLTAAAQDRIAYVIGNARFGGPALERPTKDAVSVSRALLGLGFDVVRRQNITASEFAIGARAAPTVVLYYSGRTEASEGGDILLRGAQLGDTQTAGWPVLATAQAFRDAGAEQVLVFVETCQTEGDTLAAPADDALPDGIFLAFSHDPAIGCPVAEVEAQAEADPDGDTADVADAETTEATPVEAEATPVEAVDAAPDENGARFTDKLQLALATPDAPLADAFETAAGPGWVRSSLSEPLYLWPQEEAEEDGDQIVGLPDNALEMLSSLSEEEQARMKEVWRKAGLMDSSGNIIRSRAPSAGTTTVLVAPQASSSGVTIVAQVAAPVNPVLPRNTGTSASAGTVRASAGGATQIGGRITAAQPTNVSRPASASNGVQIFEPVVRQPAAAAQPTAAGLPEPYIIIGDLRPTNASFEPVETGTVEGTQLDPSSFENRNQIRNSDPDLYSSLVSGGAYDPVDGTERGLARAIQTELARMKCYTSGIDGIWGNGSRRSVDNYFQQISETPATREPTLDLYRKIILNDDVACPVVRQAATPQRNTSSGTTRSTTTRQTAPAAAPRRQPAAPKRNTGGGGLNTNNLGSGVFR